MSDEETIAVDASEAQRLTVEYKDGQLQIVEVTPFDHDKDRSILPDMSPEGGQMMQVDPGKGLMQLDLLNLTLVRCEDGEESYRLVTASEDGSGDAVACVLHSSGDETEGQEMYVAAEEEGYVCVPAGDIQSYADTDGPAIPHTVHRTAHTASTAYPTKKLSPAELLEKAKALQKAKSIICETRIGKRGRRKKGELPPPQQLLSSPDFRLFLYSCKLCSFKCNAIKELATHRSQAHGSERKRPPVGRGHTTLQCARCPYRATTHLQLMKHVNTQHITQTNSTECNNTNKVCLDSEEVMAADVLVCGACGFESASRPHFRDHISKQHGATTV